MSSTFVPSGTQFELELGDQRAVVTEVGAAVRRYTVAGVDVLDGYGRAQMCSGARGQTFVPWPNRIADGRYEFAGRQNQLPLTEPAAHNAIHGLTRWAPWRLVHHSPTAVTLNHWLPPQPGYPYSVSCELTYRLSAAGLAVETVATNVGDAPCPYATGAHPYVRIGVDRVDDLAVRLPAATWYPTDDRGIPTGRRDVAGTDRDLRELGRIGDLRLDTAFTDLEQAPDGTTTVLVAAPDGSHVELWMDESYRYVELFTGDTLDEPHRRRSLGVEPMTAAPNAFRTGDGLVSLEPGSHHRATWGLRTRLA